MNRGTRGVGTTPNNKALAPALRIPFVTASTKNPDQSLGSHPTTTFFVFLPVKIFLIWE